MYRYINIEPLFVDMSKTHIIVASEECVYIWQYRKHSKVPTTIEGDKRFG